MLVLASSFAGLTEGLFVLNAAVLALAVLGLGLQRWLQKRKKHLLLRAGLAVPPVAMASLLAWVHFHDPPEFLWFRVLSGSAVLVSLAAVIYLRPAPTA
jgi:hypothetical protein